MKTCLFKTVLGTLAAASLGVALAADTSAPATNALPSGALVGGKQTRSVKRPQGPKTYPTIGAVRRLDPSLDALIAPGTKIEKLAGGFKMADGPVWDRKANTLLFSDVMRNVVFEWKEDYGTRDGLFPSGYTGTTPRKGWLGSNGLTFDPQHRLVLCMEGDRRIARLAEHGHFITLVAYYKFYRLNSPNDLVYDAKGNLYFTDPPYGLPKGNDDPEKELVFNGLFLLRPSGQLVVLSRDLTYPNGVALSPDQKTLYVSVSDPKNPVIMAYTVKKDGTVRDGRVFFNAKSLYKPGAGLPEGLKVDDQGNVFATGPGGVLVLTPNGKHLGTISTGEPVSNCAWGNDGHTLYLTSSPYLCRIKTLTKGPIP